MARNRRNYELIGFDELERSFEELGKVPQTVATQSARAGASVVRKAARINAPVDEGNIENAIILKRERTKVRGKAVYDVMIDPAKSSLFVKVSKTGKRSFYPASQEYGYLTVDGRYIPGYRYMRRAADDNEAQVEKAMLDKAVVAVDKALKRK